MGGKHDPVLDSVEPLDDPPEPGLVHVGLAVNRGDDVAPGLERDRAALPGDGRELEARVGHHVADDVDLAGRVLLDQGRTRPLIRTEEDRGDVIDLDARVLLGHREVTAPKPRLHVREADARCDRRARSRQGRVRVSVDEDEVRTLAAQRLRDSRLHRAWVCGLEIEPVPRVRQLELLEEDLRQLPVVVLSGMDDDLVDAGGTKGDGKRGGLDELRPVPDHREELHEPNPKHRRGSRRRASPRTATRSARDGRAESPRTSAVT